MNSEESRSTLELFIKLFRLVKPLTFYMILAVFAGVAGFLCASFITIGGGYALLHVVGYYPELSIKTVLIGIGILAILRGLLHYLEHACNHYIAFKLLASIRDQVFGALRRLAPAKLEGADRGNLVALITSDIELLEIFFAHTISPVCIGIIMVTTMTIYISHYHLILGGIALIAYLVVGFVLPLVSAKQTREIGTRQREAFAQMNSCYLDSIRGMKEIKQFHWGDKRIAFMNKQADEMEITARKLKGYSGIATGIIHTCVLGFSLVIFHVGTVLYVNQIIDLDGVIIPTIVLFASFGPVIALANLGTGLAQTVASGNRILAILEEESNIEEVVNPIDVTGSHVEFQEVDFAYEKEQILEQLSLSIEAGKVTGIMGQSGSGKSTILKLIMRFWDVDSGQVLLGGKDVRNLSTHSLRKNQGFVTQETHLFHESIEANVRIGKLNATRQEVEEACKKASIHEFIMALPHQYETQVGELGDTLSGGECQRIGLARAFLHNGACMLLDEPTSNLDSLNEAVILKALLEDQERTTIIVSHRKSTMAVADQVIHVSGERVS
ncbi:MAG: ABC transporter ATP-binding protein [Eubacteriales bacterium]